MRKNELDSKYSLMEGFRAGQHQNFTEIFKLLYAPLCYHALKITNEEAAAEDIVEDSFIKIWERREIFFEINVLKSYLYTTVKNECLNWIKKNSKKTFLSENLFQSDVPETPHIFEYTLASEVYNQLSGALEQLSPQGKQIIKMIFFESKNTRTVAEELGISESTVKTQKGRSLQKLKTRLLFPKQ